MHTNQLYTCIEVYVTRMNQHFTFIAYKHASGSCDKQLVELTNKHGFFQDIDQARYCVERQDSEL